MMNHQKIRILTSPQIQMDARRQLALWDLLAVSIDTSNRCSVNNGPRPDRLTELLVSLRLQRHRSGGYGVYRGFV